MTRKTFHELHPYYVIDKTGDNLYYVVPRRNLDFTFSNKIYFSAKTISEAHNTLVLRENRKCVNTIPNYSDILNLPRPSFN